MTNAHHPWAVFRGLSDWTLRWRKLPFGTWGETCFDSQTVTLTTGMSQAERRCTIAHETQHILRGPVEPHEELREELLVDRAVSRLLLPSLERVVDSMAWARGDMEAAADDLWVDPLILDVRLSALHLHERRHLNERLREVML